jgi:hypothetical protein
MSHGWEAARREPRGGVRLAFVYLPALSSSYYLHCNGMIGVTYLSIHYNYQFVH